MDYNPSVKTIKEKRDSHNVIIDYSNADFRTYWEGKVEALLHESETKILQKVAFPDKGWFLDLGCGHGRLIPLYYREKRNIVCVDYAVNHLQMAAETHPQKNIHYIAADANRLPFRPGSFSGGICIRLFHHIPEYHTFFNEISRIFSTKATLLLSYMNLRNLLRIFRYGAPSFKKTHAQIANVLYATHPKFIKRLLTQNQWNLLSYSGAGFIYQIAQMNAFLKKQINQRDRLFKIAGMIDRMNNHFLGKLNLALMQYLEIRNRNTSAGRPASSSIMDILQCPACGSTQLISGDEHIHCLSCSKTYPQIGRIYDFRLQ